jgi:hypothetical protein
VRRAGGDASSGGKARKRAKSITAKIKKERIMNISEYGAGAYQNAVVSQF